MLGSFRRRATILTLFILFIIVSFQRRPVASSNESSVAIKDGSQNSSQQIVQLLPDIENPACLVHIGKTAGSTASCGLGFMYANCEGMPYEQKSPLQYFHMQRNGCLPDTKTLIVTVRDPVGRIQSWFNFEKDTLPVRRSVEEQERLRRKRALLFDCFPTFSDLLDGLVQVHHNQEEFGGTIRNMTCPQRAWAAVSGSRQFAYHEWFNYEHYWEGIQSFKASVYVIRSERLEEDWTTVSSLPPYRAVNKKSSKSNESISDVQMKALCQALCREFSYFAKFLRLAKNLEEKQVTSTLEAIITCNPLETCEDEPPSVLPIPVARYRLQSETKKRLFTLLS